MYNLVGEVCRAKYRPCFLPRPVLNFKCSVRLRFICFVYKHFLNKARRLFLIIQNIRNRFSVLLAACGVSDCCVYVFNVAYFSNMFPTLFIGSASFLNICKAFNYLLTPPVAMYFCQAARKITRNSKCFKIDARGD